MRLLAGLTALTLLTAAAPLRAGHSHDRNPLELAERTHDAALALEAFTGPHAPYCSEWGHVARGAGQAGQLAARIEDALATGNGCAALELAESLESLTDHLADDAEDLHPYDGRRGFGACRVEVRQAEQLAERLDDLAEDLRKAVKRVEHSLVPVLRQPVVIPSRQGEPVGYPVPQYGSGTPGYGPSGYGTRIPRGSVYGATPNGGGFGEPSYNSNGGNGYTYPAPEQGVGRGGAYEGGTTGAPGGTAPSGGPSFGRPAPNAPNQYVPSGPSFPAQTQGVSFRFGRW